MKPNANTIVSAWTATDRPPLLRAALTALAGSMLIALCARIQVPMWPVPMTMQSFAVIVLALAMGARLAFATVALYLAQGAIGLPVFAGGGGLMYFFGPTGGYLFGFLLAAGLMGSLADRGWSRTAPLAFSAAILGSGVVYLCGAGWLATFVGLQSAIAQGVMPFLPGDAIKAALAAACLPAAWRVLRLIG